MNRLSKHHQGEPPRSPNPADAPNKNYNLPKCHLVKLTLRCQDPELPDRETWAAGPGSEGCVLRRWKKENPTLAALLVSHQLVTPKREARVLYPYLQPKGPRVEVADANLERAAKNMLVPMLRE